MQNRKVKRISAALLGISLLLSLSGCTETQTSQPDYTLSEQHKIIFDTDTAGDDAMALMMAAKAENIDLMGVTVLAGNVSLEQGCQNALMTLEVSGRTDVPVYKGSDIGFSGEEIVPHSVFGEDGMGDLDLIHPETEPADGDGVDFIIETVKNDPGEIEILATGPLTNIAKAIEKDPGTMEQVKKIWVMGTGGTQNTGNATPTAEFNVYKDIEAYQYVLESGIPVTVVGYDMCGVEGVRIGKEELETFSGCGDSGEFLSKALSSFVENYANDKGYAAVCDPVAVAVLIWSDFTDKTVACGAEVVTHDCPAKGTVLFYKQGVNYDMFDEDTCEYNIDVVTELNSGPYFENVCRLIR